MRIGVDGTCWANERGYGRFAREIVRAMIDTSPDDHFVCFVDESSAQRMKLDASNAEIVKVSLGVSPSEAASASGYRSLFDMLAMSRAVSRQRLDVFFSPSVYTYFPLPPGLKAVVTIHDAIAERFPELTLPSTSARLFWWLKMRLAVFQARRILTVSDYAARDVHRIHGIPRERIDVAVEAPAHDFQVRTNNDIAEAIAPFDLRPDDRWFIYVGGFNPHKNIDSIIRAHREVVSRAKDRPPHLLLVGTLTDDVFHGDANSIRAEIEAAGTASLIHWTGFVPDVPLSSLLSGAIALLLPSQVEGFGLPAIEAAACGIPVIATKESPLPQLLDGGGYFVTPGNTAELSRAMLQFLNDDSLRAMMGEKAKERASALSWEAAAAAAMSSLRAAAT